jgi:histidinol-phosphate phosphatase family protein
LNNKPAIFLDRDGTIIEDRGYLEHPSQVKFFNETFSSLQRLSELFKLFIVTNQSGAAKKLISIENIKRVNSHIENTFKNRGINIVETYVCPHDKSDDCECMKPKPYFIKKAQMEHDIDLLLSFVIGDHPHDIEFAENVGAKGIYVLTGHGRKHLDELSPNTLIARGISEATDLILKLNQKAMNNPRGSTA